MGCEDLKNATAVYAEDEELVRMMVTKALKRVFGAVHEAANGAEALELFDLHRPDIVITDIEMPIMNGLRLIEQVKSRSNSVPCIVVTAYKDEAHQSAVADATVYKPIIVAELIEKIKEACKSHLQK